MPGASSLRRGGPRSCHLPRQPGSWQDSAKGRESLCLIKRIQEEEVMEEVVEEVVEEGEGVGPPLLMEAKAP